MWVPLWLICQEANHKNQCPQFESGLQPLLPHFLPMFPVIYLLSAGCNWHKIPPTFVFNKTY